MPKTDALIREAVDLWPQFDTDEPVSGADLVDWFGAWRKRVRREIEAQRGGMFGRIVANPDMNARQYHTVIIGMIENLRASGLRATPSKPKREAADKAFALILKTLHEIEFPAS